MASRFEFLEVDLYGESGTEMDLPDSPHGQGNRGYIAKLNAFGADGWSVVNVDIDQRSHIRCILQREIVEAIPVVVVKS